MNALPELHVARLGPTSAEPRSLARDAERGLLTRVRPGVYVDRSRWEAQSTEQRHLTAMHAYAAVAARSPVFSHWSAALLAGLPTHRAHLRRVHIATDSTSGRSVVGIAAHVMAVAARDVITIDGLRATTTPRTAADIALSAPFADGVMVADGALRAGLDRAALQQAVEDAADRRGSARARSVAAFARAEAESPAESRSRVTMLQLGIAPPVLQFEVRDWLGLAGRLDFWFPEQRIGGEVDGEQKYLELAKDGTAASVIREKWREDRVRRSIGGLARWGWTDAGSASRLAGVLAASGVHPPSPRATLADYCAAPLT